jgi:hypothetical protein
MRGRIFIFIFFIFLFSLKKYTIFHVFLYIFVLLCYNFFAISSSLLRYVACASVLSRTESVLGRLDLLDDTYVVIY